MAAPEGTPFYKDAEELQIKIDEYFNGDGMRTKRVITKEGHSVEIPVPTISGLAYHLGFASRQSMYDYEKREELSYTIKRARLYIECEYEMQLQTGNTTGAIFALKNMGWLDQTVNKNINLSTEELTPEQIKEKVKKLEDDY